MVRLNRDKEAETETMTKIGTKTEAKLPAKIETIETKATVQVEEPEEEEELKEREPRLGPDFVLFGVHLPPFKHQPHKRRADWDRLYHWALERRLGFLLCGE